MREGPAPASIHGIGKNWFIQRKSASDVELSKTALSDLTVEPTCSLSVLRPDCFLGTGEEDMKLFSDPPCPSLGAIRSSFPTGGEFKEKPRCSEQAEGFALKASVFWRRRQVERQCLPQTAEGQVLLLS